MLEQFITKSYLKLIFEDVIILLLLYDIIDVQRIKLPKWSFFFERGN